MTGALRAASAMFAAAVLVAGCGTSSPTQVELVDAFATVTGGVATFYLRLEGDADRIVDATATTPDGQEVDVRLHQVEIEGGVPTMVGSDGIDLTEGRNDLGPGTSHLMAPGLDPPPEPGERLGLTLQLDHGGMIAGQVDVVAFDEVPAFGDP